MPVIQRIVAVNNSAAELSRLNAKPGIVAMLFMRTVVVIGVENCEIVEELLRKLLAENF